MRTFILTLLSALFLTTINAQSWQTLFYDDFNRADGALGSNYTTSPSGGITQLGIVNNEVKVANGGTAPAYWIVSYNNGVSEDSIRISCKFRTPVLGYGFSISARDNGINTYRAGIMSASDSIYIYRSSYSGSSTTLASAKANFDISKTYFLEFTLQGADLSCRFVAVGMTDTITINATDNLLSGNNITLSAYYYQPNMSLYFDDFKIESSINTTGIDDFEKNNSCVFPNPASNFITFNIGNVTKLDLIVNIYNVTGNVVKSEILQQNLGQIYIGDLSNGIYMVELKSKEWAGRQKLIIQK